MNRTKVTRPSSADWMYGVLATPENRELSLRFVGKAVGHALCRAARAAAEADLLEASSCLYEVRITDAVGARTAADAAADAVTELELLPWATSELATATAAARAAEAAVKAFSPGADGQDIIAAVKAAARAAGAQEKVEETRQVTRLRAMLRASGVAPDKQRA